MLNAMFWLAVACIPLAIHHEVVSFMVNNCMPGSECLNQAMPLIVQIGLVSWAARILLWPLAAWNLGGRWLWLRFRSGRWAQADMSSNNA